jgi:8-oxo-dGTP diphosphatase
VSATNDFPEARWWGSLVTFSPVSELPPEPFAAVVVFAIHPEGFALADIPNRGWCVPSGRPEPGETPVETAVRETAEEVGGVLQDPRLIGVYTIRDDDGSTRFVPAFVGRVDALGPLPPGTESRGARIVRHEELPGIYWLWDDLMARMFDFALEQWNRASQ